MKKLFVPFPVSRQCYCSLVVMLAASQLRPTQKRRPTVAMCGQNFASPALVAQEATPSLTWQIRSRSRTFRAHPRF